MKPAQPSGGHENCPVVPMGSAQWLATCGRGSAGQGVHPLAGEGLGEADPVAAGWQTWAWWRSPSAVAVARVLA
jgi:hypothetical protein